MKFREITCKSCGADMRIGLTDKSGNCEYCGAYYIVMDKEPVHIYNYIGNFKITPLKIFLFIVIVLFTAFAIAFPLIIYAQKNNVDNPLEEPPAPYVYEDPRAYKFAGQYLVGEDMDSGEYVVYCDPLEDIVSVHVALTPTATSGTANRIYYFTHSYRTFVKVEDGQYLTVKNGNIFKLDVFKIEPESDGGYAPNVELRVGVDILEGEYLLHNGTVDTLYYRLYNSDRFNANRSTTTPVWNIAGRTYVKVKDGEYISVSGGKLYPLSAMPPFSLNEDGSYPIGQYKVGADIGEGDYILNYNKQGQFYKITYDTPLFSSVGYPSLSRTITVTLSETGNVDYFTPYASCYIFVADNETLKKAGN